MAKLPRPGELRPQNPKIPKRQVISATPEITVFSEEPGYNRNMSTPRFLAWMRETGAQQ